MLSTYLPAIDNISHDAIITLLKKKKKSFPACTENYFEYLPAIGNISHDVGRRSLLLYLEGKSFLPPPLLSFSLSLLFPPRVCTLFPFYLPSSLSYLPSSLSLSLYLICFSSILKGRKGIDMAEAE